MGVHLHWLPMPGDARGAAWPLQPSEHQNRRASWRVELPRLWKERALMPPPDVEARLSAEREREIRRYAELDVPTRAKEHRRELLRELDAARRERDEAFEVFAQRATADEHGKPCDDCQCVHCPTTWAKKEIAELKRENARAWQGAALLQEAEKVLEQRAAAPPVSEYERGRREGEAAAMGEARTLVMHEQLQEGYERGLETALRICGPRNSVGECIEAIRSLKDKPEGPAGGEGDG